MKKKISSHKCFFLSKIVMGANLRNLIKDNWNSWQSSHITRYIYIEKNPSSRVDMFLSLWWPFLMYHDIDWKV